MLAIRYLIVCLLTTLFSVAARGDSGFWGPPENLGPPINSPANELSGVLCPTGLNLFFARTVTGQNDLFAAPREGDGWGRPAALTALNTPLYNELNLTFGRDGARVYFTTNRPGGPGGFDIWTSAFSGATWLPPEPMGPEVNSSGDEWYAAEGTDGLYISARTSSGLNRGDILFAAGVYPNFAPHLPLPPFATSSREMSAFPNPDGSALYITADYVGSLGRGDLWFSRRSGASWAAPCALLCGINAEDFDLYPSVSTDQRELIFASFGRPGGRAVPTCIAPGGTPWATSMPTVPPRPVISFTLWSSFSAGDRLRSMRLWKTSTATAMQR